MQALVWGLVGLGGTLLLVTAAPRLVPLLPGDWSINRTEAETLAVERLRDLGEPVDGAYTVVRLRPDVRLERRLQLLAASADPAVLRRSLPAANQVVWDVLVYPPGANPGEWKYRAWIGRAGEIFALRRQDSEAEAPTEPPPADDTALRSVAREHLEALGVDLSDFLPTPEVQRYEIGRQAGATVRFRAREAVLGPDIPYGVAATFQGSEPRGFAFWYEDAGTAEVARVFRQSQLLGIGRSVLFYLLLPLVAVLPAA